MSYYHMIHLMLGSTFEVAIRNLTGYVLNYEDKSMSDFFSGMLCTGDEDGNLHFMATARVENKAEGAAVFNSEPDDAFCVELAEETVIEKKNQDAYLKNYFSRLFDERVTINSNVRTPILHVCIYLPMYDEELWNMAKTLITAINAQNRNIEADLFLFAPDLAYLFTPEDLLPQLPTFMLDYEQNARRIIKEAIAFKDAQEGGRRFSHIIAMQNCNARGISLNLDWDSFVRIIGEFAIAAMNSYFDIFQQNAELDGRPVHAFGLCVLNLDKNYYVRYLLNKAYVTILEREGIDRGDIDVNEPSHRAQKALEGDGNLYRFYENFYLKKIKGNIVDGKSEEDINAKATKEIDEDVNAFIASVTSFLNDDSISLPEKRVTLAQLLGMDDELMTGDMFNPDQLLFRDSYADCIEMFVRANNELLRKDPAHLYVEIPQPEDIHSKETELEEDSSADEGPSSGDTEQNGEEKKKARSNKGAYPEQLKSYAVLADDNIDFRKMNADLKNYEVKIRRQTEYIRTLENDLKNCEVQEAQSDTKHKILTEDGFRFGDVVYRMEPIETIPLEETYTPRKGRTLPKSVDLRKNFPMVKSQGQVGSCLAFTITSIFEYILKRGHKLDADLSERYLYYNGRIEAQRREGKEGEPLEDLGIAFIDAFNSLKVNGLCREELCRYDASGSNKDEEPSEEAYSDGKTRLVTEAKNVRLSEYDIKSALDEGYPVAVSVNIYESFESTHLGFISLPNEEEVQQWNESERHARHAMVICGYSDESKVFVVRNSWGVDFGDNGYCYMPYSYITNETYTNQACIITGTNLVSSDSVKDTRSHETVSFDKMNPEINAAIMRVLIAEAKVEKAALLHLRSDLYSAYTMIEKRLVNPETRSALTKGTEERLKWEVGEIQKQKRENELNEELRIKELDRSNTKSNIVLGICVVVLIAVRIILGMVNVSVSDDGSLKEISLFRMIDQDFPLSEVFYGLFGLCAIVIGVWWILYFRRRKVIHKEHSETNCDLENMEDARTRGGANNAGNMGLYLKALNIRMFLPWLVVRKLSEQNRILEQKYQTMVNYTKNLYEWYLTEKKKIGEMSPDMREPFISLLSNSTLDKYYSQNADEITAGVKLSSLFAQGYSIEDDAIVKFQNMLKNKIIGVLEDSLKGFSVYKYLVGKTDFPFADKRKADIHEMLRRLEEKSEIFIRLGPSPVTMEAVNATTTVLMSSDISDDIQMWNSEFQRDFSTAVSHIRINSPNKLSFLQMKRLPLEECLDLYEPDEPVKPVSRRKDGKN